MNASFYLLAGAFLINLKCVLGIYHSAKCIGSGTQVRKGRGATVLVWYIGGTKIWKPRRPRFSSTEWLPCRNRRQRGSSVRIRCSINMGVEGNPRWLADWANKQANNSPGVTALNVSPWKRRHLRRWTRRIRPSTRSAAGRVKGQLQKTPPHVFHDL